MQENVQGETVQCHIPGVRHNSLPPLILGDEEHAVVGDVESRKLIDECVHYGRTSGVSLGCICCFLIKIVAFFSFSFFFIVAINILVVVRVGAFLGVLGWIVVCNWW
jgi:hypothetical protein